MNSGSMFKTGTCPCGSGKTFEVCCRLYLDELKSAPTAEALMRSIYIALERNDKEYLLRTWHESTRPRELVHNPAMKMEWHGFLILSVKAGAPIDDVSTIEYVAQYSMNGKRGTLHEISDFVREHGVWFYLRGRTAARAVAA